MILLCFGNKTLFLSYLFDKQPTDSFTLAKQNNRRLFVDDCRRIASRSTANTGKVTCVERSIAIASAREESHRTRPSSYVFTERVIVLGRHRTRSQEGESARLGSNRIIQTEIRESAEHHLGAEPSFIRRRKSSTKHRANC